MVTTRNKRYVVIILGLSSLMFIWMIRIFGPDYQIVTTRLVPYVKGNHQSENPQQTIPTTPTTDLSHLRRLVKTSKLKYAQRTIRTQYYEGSRPDLTRVNETLFTSSQPLWKNDLHNVHIEEQDVLALPIPRSPIVNTSIMSFAIATKPDRLQRSTHILHWLPNTDAQLHATTEASDMLPTIEHDMRAEGINLSTHASDLPFEKAYLSGIKTLYDARGPQTEWLVLIDDDTFIPSLPYLVHYLNTRYDSTIGTLVGATTDNFEQVKGFGLIPFGGGGIFISVPLAAELVQDDVWKKCMASDKHEGDGLVNACLNEYSAVRPSFDPGLNQMDFHGDPGGYFESGRRMLTVHHWKSWFEVDIPMACEASKACGFECLFQRFHFDDDIVLSNGYSIVEYPKGIEDKKGNVKVDLKSVELTWEGEKRNYEHHIGPLRERLSRDQKKTMRLVESTIIEGKGVRQTYLDHQEKEKWHAAPDDSIVELIWLF